MRRSLVLTDETARHPFRASLPPHVTRGGGPIRPGREIRVVSGGEVASKGEWAGESHGMQGLAATDGLRQFVLAYCACFVAVGTFIA
ncbi:hypothetical protein H0274_05625 [Altererythrobacter sp. CC-YST694]|nr:hypothetical protein [Altererythrobacter sp. CC-YST694]